MSSPATWAFLAASNGVNLGMSIQAHLEGTNNGLDLLFLVLCPALIVICVILAQAD